MIRFVTTDGASNALQQIEISAPEEEVILKIIFDGPLDDGSILGEEDLDISNVTSDEILVLLKCLEALDISEDDTSGDESMINPVNQPKMQIQKDNYD